MKVKLVLIDTYNSDQSGVIQKPPKPFYYIESGHISAWRYSPPNCEKVIETIFEDYSNMIKH